MVEDKRPEKAQVISTNVSPELLEEIRRGEGLSLGEAARRLPGRGGTRAAPSTLWRWVRLGVQARDGARVRLEAGLLGGRYATTPGALERFVVAVNGAQLRSEGEPNQKAERAAEVEAALERHRL